MAEDSPTLALVVPFPKKETAWTPESCLQAFLDDVKAGRIKPKNVMIFYLEDDANGGQRPHYWMQNVSYTEAIAYGQLITRMQIDEWRQ